MSKNNNQKLKFADGTNAFEDQKPGLNLELKKSQLNEGISLDDISKDNKDEQREEISLLKLPNH